jgi:hypothetical protein
VHAVTLHQNLHQFQAGENTRNAASGKAFCRTGAQNDPLEGGKIPYSSNLAPHHFNTVDDLWNCPPPLIFTN